MTLDEKRRELLDKLAVLRSAQERFGWLVEAARQRPKMDPALRLEANRIEGCLARLWFVAEFREGRCFFQSESDSLIVKAVAGLLCEFYSGHHPDEILRHPPDFLSKLGLTQHLTENRRNGLARVWERIRAFAEGHDPAHSTPVSRVEK